MAQVNLKKVTKKFSDGTLAVDSISLEVADREFLVLVGPSGCGKSTTLRSIAGLETPDAGTIEIGEVSVNEVAPKDRDIAMVFQNYALYPHMSVYKNLSFGLNLRFGGGLIARVLRRIFQPREATEMARKRSGIDHQVRQAAERLGIDHLLDRKPHQLSGGERQRVALGRAIVRNPAAFLFDEPLSNLDAKLRQQMRVELKRLHRELQATMIYVTHDQVEAMTLGDRVAVMNRGKIMQVGSPLDVYQQPANLFVARFIGSVPINLWRATVRQQENRTVVQGENSLQLTLDGTQQSPALSPGSSLEVIVGVRSENLRLVTADEENVRGKVVAVDRLGESAIVHVDPLTDGSAGEVDQREDLPGLDSNPFGAMVVRAESMSTVEVGQEVSIGIDSSRVNWFDRQTGENLLKEEK